MTPRKYSREFWQRVRGLFISGCSLRDIARQTRISLGTICARAAREKWQNERNGVIETRDKIDANGHDSRSEAVAAVVLENKVATLIAESRLARLLAEKALAAVAACLLNRSNKYKRHRPFEQTCGQRGEYHRNSKQPAKRNSSSISITKCRMAILVRCSLLIDRMVHHRGKRRTSSRRTESRIHHPAHNAPSAKIQHDLRHHFFGLPLLERRR
jgi:hypothetical protein